MARLTGDKLLVGMMRSRADAAAAQQLFSRAARCWSTFGLPDGSRDARRITADGMNVLLTPSEELIQQAMNRLLKPILDADHHWLLEIPRVLMPNQSSAEVRISQRGAVMGFPLSAFGGLYLGNLLLMQIDGDSDEPLDARTRRAKTASRALKKRIPPGLGRQALASWMNGTTPSPKFAQATSRLESADTLFAGMMSEGARRSMWAMTTFQQAVMLLHEFGHVDDLARRNVATEVHRHSLAEELYADAWGHRYVKRLAKRLFTGPDDVQGSIAGSLLQLYALLDQSEIPEGADRRRAELAERCSAYIRSLAPNSQTAALITPEHALAYFDWVGSKLSQRIPVPFMFIMYEVFIRQFEGKVTYEDEAAAEHSNLKLWLPKRFWGRTERLQWGRGVDEIVVHTERPPGAAHRD